MYARSLVTALGALAAAITLATGTAQALPVPLSVDSARETNGNAMIAVSYVCTGPAAALSVTVRATPYLGTGVNGSSLAPVSCTGQTQQATVTVNPVQIFGESAKFQSGSVTDVTVTVIDLTLNSLLCTTKKRIDHLG
ncbi:hypothetical protein ACFYUD_16460 [Nocardia tengchongensis]|uniref:Spore-associated protein n=1 Tax=Nocardia tengchongensis TaxID=2055889 RepID=A0ABX8CU19_9NOCA|nr:hypothetical protein [Nocardia tengchongensis]QVI23406.1 hypothetical protein KHQ06_11290 [Nocardia tengchongensis]